jgi:ATP-dependent Clp protease protease subunit
VLKLKEQLNQILAKHTGQTIEQIAQDSDRDRFMDGPQAVEYGLVDTVLDKRPQTSGSS